MINDQLIKLKGEKDTVVLQMEADQQIAELQKNLDQYNSSNVAQEGLEEVREGAKKLSEQAKGVAIAYESSAETLDYRMEQDERQQEAQAILDQMKNARKQQINSSTKINFTNIKLAFYDSIKHNIQ